MAREIVKSENATVKIPELELEIPACQKGLLSTIEGIISTAYEELEEYSNKNKVSLQYKFFLSITFKFHSNIRLFFRLLILNHVKKLIFSSEN